MVKRRRAVGSLRLRPPTEPGLSQRIAILPALFPASVCAHTSKPSELLSSASFQILICNMWLSDWNNQLWIEWSLRNWTNLNELQWPSLFRLLIKLLWLLLLFPKSLFSSDKYWHQSSIVSLSETIGIWCRSNNACSYQEVLFKFDEVVEWNTLWVTQCKHWACPDKTHVIPHDCVLTRQLSIVLFYGCGR